MSGNFLKRFKLLTHSYPNNIHKCVKGMVVDQRRSILFSTGKEGTIHAQDLAKKITFGAIKCKNNKPEALEYEHDMQRLIVASREGQILIFDCRNPIPLMIHFVNLRRPNSGDYIKQIDFDPLSLSLFCRSKLGEIAQIQLIYKQRHVKSLKLEKVDSYKNTKNKEWLTKFKVMSRMASYCEGTNLGFIRIRDPLKAGECLLNL